MKLNKNKTKYYYSVGTISKYNRKIVERVKIEIPNTHIHDRSLFWLVTGTSMQWRG